MSYRRTASAPKGGTSTIKIVIYVVVAVGIGVILYIPNFYVPKMSPKDNAPAKAPAAPSKAEGVSLLQAIQKAESETKLTVISASTAGEAYTITAVGGGKTKSLKVNAKSGIMTVEQEADAVDKGDQQICEKLKVSCSAAASAAATKGDGVVVSIKASVAGEAVKFTAQVQGKAGPVTVEVDGVTGQAK